jgi:tetratricopeptide (TPR) repeat protein
VRPLHEDRCVLKQTASPLRATFALLLAIQVMLAPGVAAADDGDELKARTHFAAGEYKQALDIYARLYAETMHPTYLRNIARCHQNLGNADQAISSFREYLRKARDLTPDQRAEIEGYIAEMEQMKRGKATTAPPAAVAPPAAAEPTPSLVGPPTVTAGRSADEPGPIYTRVWFWAVVAGVAAAGAFGVYALTADRSATHGSLGVLDLSN